MIQHHQRLRNKIQQRRNRPNQRAIGDAAPQTLDFCRGHQNQKTPQPRPRHHLRFEPEHPQFGIGGNGFDLG